MKNMKRVFVFISLVLIVMLCSCASLNNANAPSWYYKPQSKANSYELAFVGKGTASTERQALLIAYSDMNSKLYAYIGREVSTESYRDLSRNGRIDAFDFDVVEKFQVSDSGLYTVYILGLGNKALIQKFRSEAMLIESNIAAQAEKLILEGDEYIKTNQDLLGVRKYIQSMVLSYPVSQIEEEYSFNEIFKEVLNIINSINMNIIKSDSSSASCTLRIKRKGTLIPSKVQNAPVKASYSAVDSRNRHYDDSFTFASAEDGTFEFSPKNHTFMKTGSVVFSYDLYNEIAELAKVAPAAADEILKAVENTSVVFDYSRNYRSMNIGISALEYTVNGDYVQSSLINDYLQTHFADDGIDTLIIKTDSKANCDLVLETTVGFTDYAQSKTGSIAVTSRGSLKLYEQKTGKIIYESNAVFSNGFGDTEEAALENSYSNFAAIIYSIVKAFYV